MFKELFTEKIYMKKALENLLDKQEKVFVQMKDNSFGYVEDISGNTAYLANAHIVGYKQYKYMEVDIDDIKEIRNDKLVSGKNEAVSFGQDTSGSKEYADAMSNHRDKTLIEMAAIGKKFKATGKPERMKVSGVAEDGYQMILYVSKDKKHSISLRYYSPRDGWSVSICWGVTGNHCESSTKVSLRSELLSVTGVDSALQDLANKFPAMSTDTSKWGKAKFFPVKWPAAFQKRIPRV